MGKMSGIGRDIPNNGAGAYPPWRLGIRRHTSDLSVRGLSLDLFRSERVGYDECFSWKSGTVSFGLIERGREKGKGDSSTIDAQGFPCGVDFRATLLSVGVLSDEGPVELLDVVCDGDLILNRRWEMWGVSKSLDKRRGNSKTHSILWYVECRFYQDYWGTCDRGRMQKSLWWWMIGEGDICWWVFVWLSSMSFGGG
jgi:hypothetical protein